MIVYDVIATRFHPGIRPEVVLFYDEDKEKAIKFMNDHMKKNGYSISETDGRFPIADIILRERTGTGEEISRRPYKDFFDVYGNRLKEEQVERRNV